MTLVSFVQAQTNYDSKIFKKVTTHPRLQQKQSVISFKQNEIFSAVLDHC